MPNSIEGLTKIYRNNYYIRVYCKEVSYVVEESN